MGVGSRAFVWVTLLTIWTLFVWGGLWLIGAVPVFYWVKVVGAWAILAAVCWVVAVLEG